MVQLLGTTVRAHCQVPCGIYDDSGRINKLKEDATTIHKAMKSVVGMKASYEEDPQSLNQSVRWINTKEQHASQIITTVSEYFLTQKLKDVGEKDDKYNDYLIALALHHRVMRLAMKAKQSMDPKVADELKHAIEHLENSMTIALTLPCLENQIASTSFPSIAGCIQAEQ